MTDNYPLLANRLTSQTEFTQEEWDELGIKDMKLLDYICADKFYFQPSPPSGRIIAVRWDQQQDNSKKFDEPPNQVNLSAEHVRGLHIEVQARDQASNERMRLGGIVFSWEEGQHLKRVPYFIVPDGWAKESSFVDMVIQGMKLKTPNMVCAIHVGRPEPRACTICTRGTHAQMAHTHRFSTSTRSRSQSVVGTRNGTTLPRTGSLRCIHEQCVSNVSSLQAHLLDILHIHPSHTSPNHTPRAVTGGQGSITTRGSRRAEHECRGGGQVHGLGCGGSRAGYSRRCRPGVHASEGVDAGDASAWRGGHV